MTKAGKVTVLGVAVAALLLAVTPFALRSSGAARPVRPVTTPSPSPSPTPSASATPSASPRPSPTAAGPAEFAAVTAAGDLVLVSTATGKRTRTITRLDAVPGRLDLSPDGGTVYFAVYPAGFDPGEPTTETCPTVHAVDVASGAQRAITRGYAPVLSPDGARLAVATCPTAGVRIVGGRTYPLREGAAGGVYDIASLAWTEDGAGIYVQHGGDHANPMTLLDLATADTVDDAVPVADGTDFSNTPVPWRDGTLLRTEVRSYELGEDFPVGVVDAGDRESYRVLFRLPESNESFDDPAITDVVAGPDGQILVQTETSLYRWTGSGAPVRLGPAYARIAW